MNIRKRIARALICLGFAALVYPGLGAAGNMGKLSIDITDIPASEGYIMVAVYNVESAYKGDGEPVARARIEVAGTAVRAVFADLAYGWYGVAIYHDRNSNGKLDTGAFGIPKEAYGHSNNVRGTFGPPAFDKIKFELDKEDKPIRIALK